MRAHKRRIGTERSRAIGAPYGKLEEAYLALAAQLGLLREDV